jgi:hypothetical protein
MDLVLFFYSPLPNKWEWAPNDKDIAISASNNDPGFTRGVCAYMPGRNRLYACPAPDRYAYFAFRCSRLFSESSMYVETDGGFGLLTSFPNVVSVGPQVKPALTTPIPTSLTRIKNSVSSIKVRTNGAAPATRTAAMVPAELASEAKRCSAKTA